ncbi:hypothetical protein PGT21_032988 [Puccinia graminis f. sp. tritici]|nr:hypothetical protein PGT21_032988 [Puccinia graminis f. sp. tritici]KAA1133310.1 hypothetical protein PGTUg99_022751 [Puccinia graminis f. sp. tritici]
MGCCLLLSILVRLNLGMEIQSTQEPVKIAAKQRSAIYLHEQSIRQLPSNDLDLESQQLTDSSNVVPTSSPTNKPASDPQKPEEHKITIDRTGKAQGPQIQGKTAIVSNEHIVGDTPAGLHAESQELQTVPRNREFGLQTGFFLVFTHLSGMAIFLFLLYLLPRVL